MDWDSSLIALYLLICNAYEKKLGVICQKLTNGGYKRFSDEEVMTLYLFGQLIGLRNMKQIHQYAQRHLLSYFPNLPGYPAFAHRIKVLGNAFRALVMLLQSQQSVIEDERVYLVDSFPIALAKGHHAYTAKVAAEVAGKSFNSTKKMYYHGVKAHVVARKNEARLPDIELFIVDTASRQDGPIFDEILRPHLHNNVVFADQAYRRPDAEQAETQQDLKVFTPAKKRKGEKKLDADKKAFSKVISKMRQPIEALFGWLQRITGIEDASFVRSTSGLITHIFGKLAAAMILKDNPCFDF